jgi:hypothetical protein
MLPDYALWQLTGSLPLPSDIESKLILIAAAVFLD